MREETEIKAEAEDCFREFLQHQPEDFTGMTVECLQELLPFRCSNSDTQALLSPVTTEEIRDVLFAMPSNKSPGPDGFNAEFYKSTWGILGPEFVTAVQAFFIKGFLPKGINSTILALIPKKKNRSRGDEGLPTHILLQCYLYGDIKAHSQQAKGCSSPVCLGKSVSFCK